MSRTTEQLIGPLVGVGFLRRAGHIYTIDLGADVQGWLGLNEETDHQPKGHVAINPVVGVRHQRLEATVAKLENRRASLSATVSSPLGYLMPERRFVQWVITPEADPTTLSSLLEALQAVGLPFMRAHETLPAILAAMRRNLGFRLEYKIPVALMLLGDNAGARDELRHSTRALGARHDPAAESFRQFSGRLLQELEGHKPGL